jgi:hypothetical protein
LTDEEILHNTSQLCTLLKCDEFSTKQEQIGTLCDSIRKSLAKKNHLGALDLTKSTVHYSTDALFQVLGDSRLQYSSRLDAAKAFRSISSYSAYHSFVKDFHYKILESLLQLHKGDIRTVCLGSLRNLSNTSVHRLQISSPKYLFNQLFVGILREGDYKSFDSVLCILKNIAKLKDSRQYLCTTDSELSRVFVGAIELSRTLCITRDDVDFELRIIGIMNNLALNENFRAQLVDCNFGVLDTLSENIILDNTNSKSQIIKHQSLLLLHSLVPAMSESQVNEQLLPMLTHCLSSGIQKSGGECKQLCGKILIQVIQIFDVNQLNGAAISDLQSMLPSENLDTQTNDL